MYCNNLIGHSVIYHIINHTNFHYFFYIGFVVFKIVYICIFRAIPLLMRVVFNKLDTPWGSCTVGIQLKLSVFALILKWCVLDIEIAINNVLTLGTCMTRLMINTLIHPTLLGGLLNWDYQAFFFLFHNFLKSLSVYFPKLQKIKLYYFSQHAQNLRDNG